MGASCEKCCSGRNEYYKLVNTQVKHENWAEAVHDGNLVGLQFMHQDDPDLINEPVDEYNGQVIHYAVKLKNKKMLEYVLETGGKINAQGGLKYNSALHEAVLIKDWDSVRILFAHNINDELRNNEGKMAIELCETKHCLREFTKAKQFRKKHKQEGFGRQSHFHRAQKSKLMIGGFDLNASNEAMIRRYVKETDEDQNWLKRKKEEIADREIPVTSFGEDTDIDLDEIALMMTAMDNKTKEKVWTNLTKKNKNKNADCISKQTEMAKLIYGLTVLCLKKKHPRSKKPPMSVIRKLTELLIHKLPKKKGKIVLEKQKFVNEFSQIFFALHKEMVELESY